MLFDIFFKVIILHKIFLALINTYRVNITIFHIVNIKLVTYNFNLKISNDVTNLYAVIF